MACPPWCIRAAATAALAVVVASGCTASPSAAPPAQPLATGAADGSSQSAPPGAAGPTGEAPECTAPTRDLLDWAGVSIASYPGPITASSLVYAASTDTGDWYVLALDRDHVRDDGARTGDSSRSVALTNAVGTAPGSGKLIPLSEGGIGKDRMISWRNVSWAGDTLAAGQRAARLAIQCLDEAQP